MKVLKFLLVVLAVIGLAFGILVATQPTEYSVSRSIVIDADHEVIHQHVTSLQLMTAWDPWSGIDPNIKHTYEGTEGQVGSKVTWESGHSDVGKGMQTIKSVTDSRVETQLDFFEPWESTCKAWFDLEEVGEGFQITWGLTGESPRPTNAFMVWYDMEELLGPDFEQGLDSLKAFCERAQPLAPADEYRGYTVERVRKPAQVFFTHREIVPFAEVANFYATHLPAISMRLTKTKYEMAGMPCGLYYDWDEENGQTDMAAAVPVPVDAEEIEGYERVVIPEGEMLKIAYYGAYDATAEAHMAMDDYIKAHKLTTGVVVHQYATDPGMEPDTAKWLTNIYYQLN